MVSVLATVAELAKLPKVSVSLPPPRSIEALAAATPSVIGIVAGAAADGLGVDDGCGVVAVGQGQAVAAGAEIDGAAGEIVGQGDGVVAGGADDGLRIGELADIDFDDVR